MAGKGPLPGGRQSRARRVRVPLRTSTVWGTSDARLSAIIANMGGRRSATKLDSCGFAICVPGILEFMESIADDHKAGNRLYDKSDVKDSSPYAGDAEGRGVSTPQAAQGGAV